MLDPMTGWFRCKMKENTAKQHTRIRSEGIGVGQPQNLTADCVLKDVVPFILYFFTPFLVFCL